MKIVIAIYRLFYPAIALMLLLFASCEYEKREELDLGSLPEIVSFQDDIIPLFGEKCTRCHDGSTTPDLRAENAYFDLSSGNYLDTEVPEESYLYKKISGSGSMAIYASDYDRALILKWIEQGAPDN
jgi:hypothetical protein